jgi:RNA polymerase sigma-70 factor (ECF subfamily)
MSLRDHALSHLPTNGASVTEPTAPPDADDFERLVEPHRASLHAHCYRMLGSVHDADDALQDALLKAWRGVHRFEGRSSFGTWLYRIATNVCLDALAGRRRRVLPIDYGPPSDTADAGRRLDDSIWVAPYPGPPPGHPDERAAPEARYEQREALELAFVSALQHLPPRQRAVLVLRDVLGFPAREVAECLDTTVVSVNSALQRARRTLERRLPTRSQQETLRAIGDERLRELVGRLVDAFEAGDVDSIVDLLAMEATFEMPPYEAWRRGRDAVADSWLMPEGPGPRLRYVPTWANAQPALGVYLLRPDGSAYRPIALDVLSFDGDEIAGLIAFRTPSVFPAFGLPEQLPA